MIAQYIKDALIENGHVVVPGLGTFKTEYQPAQLKNNGSLLLPPNAKVLFTDSVFSSDFDSLGDYIQSVTRGNRFDIEEEISAFVKQIQEHLRQQDRLAIADFGTFIISKTGKLSFEQDEDAIFLAESFGLPKVVTIPLFPISDDIEEEYKPIIAPAPIQRDEKKTILWLLFVPFAVLLFFGLYLLYDKDAYQKVSTIIKGELQTVEPLSPHDDLPALPESPLENEMATISPPTSQDSTEQKSVTLSKKEPEIVPSPTKETLQETIPKASSSVVNTATKRFYIIVGSYSSLSKAQSALKEFQKKGYSNAKIIESDKIRISLADYATKAEAEQALPTYKKEVAGAWILNY